MTRLILILFIFIGSCQIILGQKNINDNLAKIWFNGSVYELNTTEDTIAINACLITAIKDSTVIIKTETDMLGHFELTIKGEQFFNGGVQVKVERDGYNSAESFLSWQDYDRMSKGPTKWKYYFELTKKN